MFLFHNYKFKFKFKFKYLIFVWVKMLKIQRVPSYDFHLVG